MGNNGDVTQYHRLQYWFPKYIAIPQKFRNYELIPFLRPDLLCCWESLSEEKDEQAAVGTGTGEDRCHKVLTLGLCEQSL